MRCWISRCQARCFLIRCQIYTPAIEPGPPNIYRSGEPITVIFFWREKLDRRRARDYILLWQTSRSAELSFIGGICRRVIAGDITHTRRKAHGSRERKVVEDFLATFYHIHGITRKIGLSRRRRQLFTFRQGIRKFHRASRYWRPRCYYYYYYRLLALDLFHDHRYMKMIIILRLIVFASPRREKAKQQPNPAHNTHTKNTHKSCLKATQNTDMIPTATHTTFYALSFTQKSSYWSSTMDDGYRR